MIVEQNWFLEYQPGEWYLLGMFGPGYALGPYSSSHDGPSLMAHEIVPFDPSHPTDLLIRRLVAKVVK